MTKFRTNCMALAFGAAVSSIAFAEVPPTTATLLERLKAKYPATRFGAVEPTPWPGVYEVALGNQLAYVDASGQYFLFGHLFDMTTQRSITAERRDQLTRIDFGALPLDDALKEVRGSGARTLAIFSDPDCPYCRKLEAQIKTLTDVTIYTFLLPLASIHPQARSKAIAVWCASDRLAAWRALMHDQVVPSAETCDHPIDRNIALAARLGVTGTPSLIATDGRVLAGAVGSEQIESWLDRRTETRR